MSVTLQRTEWLIVSVAALSGIVSSTNSRPFSVSSSSSAAAATTTTTASVKPPPARSVSAAADDRRLRSVLIVIVVDFVASRTRTAQLRRAGRRPAATRQRRAHRGHGAGRQRHSDHGNVHSTDARAGRRTNRTHCVSGALTQLPVRFNECVHCHRERLLSVQGLYLGPLCDVC